MHAGRRGRPRLARPAGPAGARAREPGGARLPPPDQLHEQVAAVALVQQLANEVQVGHERRLQDDGHVAGVEQLDGVVLLRAAPLLGPHRQVHAEALRTRPRARASASWRRRGRAPDHAAVPQGVPLRQDACRARLRAQPRGLPRGEACSARFDGHVLRSLRALHRRLRGVRWRVPTLIGARLEVDDDQEDEHGGQQVGHVGQALPVERLLQRAHLRARAARWL